MAPHCCRMLSFADNAATARRGGCGLRWRLLPIRACGGVSELKPTTHQARAFEMAFGCRCPCSPLIGKEGRKKVLTAKPH